VVSTDEYQWQFNQETMAMEHSPSTTDFFLERVFMEGVEGEAVDVSFMHLGGGGED
jgi:hypothetical protein